MLPHYQHHSKLCTICTLTKVHLQPPVGPTYMRYGTRRHWLVFYVCRSSRLSCGSSPWSCTTRSSTPTSILDPPTTEKKHRTPPFNVYDAQLQNFKNPLFGTKASPSPQLAAYGGKHSAASDRIDLGSPACDTVIPSNPESRPDTVTTAVANLSQEINAVAGYKQVGQALQGQQ